MLFPHERGKTIVDVRIVGNESTSADTITSYLRTRAGRIFDPEVVQGDKRRLQRSGLFADTNVLTQNVNNGVVVTFQVFERPTLRYIKFLGNRGVNDKVLTKESSLKVGDALHSFSVQEARRKVEDFYHRKGYPQARVAVREGTGKNDRGAVFEISEGPMQRILSVSFIGNTIATDGRLKTQIQSKPDFIPYLALFRGKVDRNKIDEDVERLMAYYRNLGFFRARIAPDLQFESTRQWLNLKFVIDEGPRYLIRNVSIVGNSRFDSNQLQANLRLQSGQFFDGGKMNRDVTSLRDLYGGLGHVFADVSADPRFLDEGSMLDLVYDITEGQQFRVGKINVHVAGEYPHTRESVILDRLSLRPGDIVDVREVRASERRLKASQLFETDPASGKAPRIVIQPPKLEDAEEFISERPRYSAVRGQSPDRSNTVVPLDLDVYVTPRRLR
jgi:outer membrane protein insertion porin family